MTTIDLYKEKILKPKEVCKLLQVCHKTLCRWDANKVLVAHRNPHNKRFYLESQIQAFLADMMKK